jgi:glycerol-3-phosphate cytidylyltransferase-like family protein
VKKSDQDIILLDSDINSNKDFKKDSFKTTNINILLNRVRLDKKRTFKKRITILFFLIGILTALTFYFII